MRINAKCSTAVHLLLMIAVLPPHRKMTSESLAASAGCNAVEIRKLLGSLKRAGIIDVARGTGGATLKRSPRDITLLDIHAAVDASSLDALIGMHAHAHEQCPFGRNIYGLLAAPYAEIGDAVRNKMRSITLEQLLRRLEAMEPAIQVPLGEG